MIPEWSKKCVLSLVGPESMTGAECNVDCGDNSASEDEESREPLNQVNNWQHFTHLLFLTFLHVEISLPTRNAFFIADTTIKHILDIPSKNTKPLKCVHAYRLLLMIAGGYYFSNQPNQKNPNWLIRVHVINATKEGLITTKSKAKLPILFL